MRIGCRISTVHAFFTYGFSFYFDPTSDWFYGMHAVNHRLTCSIVTIAD